MIRLSTHLAPWAPGGIPLAWRQLLADRKRFAVAVAGVAFGALLMLFQLGIYQAFMVMVLRPIDAMTGDLAMISRDFQYFMATEGFPERRLYQTLADPEVAEVYPVMIRFGSWRNPETRRQYEIALLGVRPFANPFQAPEIRAWNLIFKTADGALYDAGSTPEYGAVAALLARDGTLTGEFNKRRLRFHGTFQLGQTLAAYGHILVGAEAFRRLTDRRDSTIELGMIRLRDPDAAGRVIERLNARLPPDVEVLTRADFQRREQTYWQNNTPIGFIVTAGMIIAMFVGAVIVYQILYTDINDHLKVYATLKALGLSDGFFTRLILQQGTLLPLFGVVPALALSAILFRLADTLGGLPTRLTLPDTLTVLGLTILMCVLASLLALRRLRAADPADIF